MFIFGVVTLIILSSVTGTDIHQYDSMAYPRIESKSRIGKFLKKGWDLLIGKTSDVEEEITLPDQESMQTEALRIYLEEYSKQLCTPTCTSNAEVVTKGIITIFRSLYRVYSAKDTYYSYTRLSQVKCERHSRC